MARKGSKYARKHNIDQPQKKKNKFEDEAFYDVIYDDHEFIDVFNSLSLTDQIKAYQVLKKLAETSTNKVSRAEKRLILTSRDKLETINKNAGLKKEDLLRYPLSTDEHHIIRMDCYGSIDKRPAHQLSNYYKDMLKNPLEKKIKPSQYNLEQAPMWKVFRQFENFRKIEPQIKEYLSKNKINPNILNIMGVKDFSDIIYKTFKKNDDLKVSFVEKDSDRNAFVKELVRVSGDAIFDVLNSQGHDNRYIHSLLNAMRMYGVTDVSHIIITETNFTERVLADLKKAKISVDDYAVGDKIPQDMVEYLFRHDKGILIAARDENGNRLKSADFPSFEVHHKVAVSESGKLPCLPQVNYRSNYLLVESNIHQIVLHGYDKLVVQQGKEAYRCRMEFVDEHLAFMAGFTADKQLSVNWRNYEEFVRREAEDQKYVVSYEDCLNELKENRVNFLRSAKTSPEFDIDAVAKNLRDKYVSGKVNKTEKANKTKKIYLKKLKGIEK